MSVPVLATKLYIPPPQPNAVLRSRLVERLNAGLHRKLTLISAPAGFGKTTLVREWVASRGRPVAWLSLDEGDTDPNRWLTYLIAALQTVSKQVGQEMLGALQSPQPPAIETLLTTLLNDIAAIPEPFVLVFDDYHVIDARRVDDAITFLLEHLPPQMHLIITTREDPRLPLARLRARGQLTELRAADLRFTYSEAAEFLNRAMGLNLSEETIAALESRTEGWIAGLQLAAISMQGHEDTSGFVASFTGSHRFILDYLMEEVLQKQPESVQSFLLHTSILDRMCGPLCDAVLLDAPASGEVTLDDLERANLFVVPLDNQRLWYRYHHLFAELLRQRLHQRPTSSTVDARCLVAELHNRASRWFEEHDLEIEAFQHAAAANDVERTERLIEGSGMPLYLRGGVTPVLTWLESLPPSILDTRPSLCVMFATVLTIAGHITQVESKLLAAEAAMDGMEPNDETRHLIGRIAGIRALLAVLTSDPGQMETIIVQSQRALDYLHPDNLRERAGVFWRLGLAYQFQGNRSAAYEAFHDAISASERTGNVHVTVLATSSLGKLQESDNHLHRAAETYRRVLQLVGHPPGRIACEAFGGLSRISYEWNDPEMALEYGQESVQLARQLEIASFVSSELFLARLYLARSDVVGAKALVTNTEQTVRQRNFWHRLPEVASTHVHVMLHEGNLEDAALLTQTYEIPLSRARVQLALENTAAALETLGHHRRNMDETGWDDERLKVMVLQAVAYHAHGEQDVAMQHLGDALALAESGGFIRTFLDEGDAMAQLLSEAIARSVKPDYAGRLVAAFDAERQLDASTPDQTLPRPTQPLIEPLSQRELEVLRLIAQGHSNREIGERLFLALNTVKGHNRVIFGKLQVQRRTEAVARARELELL